MIRRKWASKSEPILRALSVICGVIVAASGGLLKADASSIGKWLNLSEASQDFIRFGIYANSTIAWIIVPGVTFLAGLFSFFRYQIGNKHKWDCVSSVLEELRTAIFQGRSDLEGEPDHYNRVTLFKHRRFRFAPVLFPWTGWMVPVARTGHATVSWRITRFRAPLDDPDKAEGLAAVGFVNKCQTSVHDLPDLAVNSDPANIAEYAKKGLVPSAWVKKRLLKRHCLSRSMLSVPIEVKGSVWGSLVFDSRSPLRIDSDDEQWKQTFRIYSKVLAKLLED